MPKFLSMYGLTALIQYRTGFTKQRIDKLFYHSNFLIVGISLYNSHLWGLYEVNDKILRII